MQSNTTDCGYYVMKNMLDIVTANITTSWMKVFNDTTMSCMLCETIGQLVFLNCMKVRIY